VLDTEGNLHKKKKEIQLLYVQLSKEIDSTCSLRESLKMWNNRLRVELTIKHPQTRIIKEEMYLMRK